MIAVDHQLPHLLPAVSPSSLTVPEGCMHAAQAGVTQLRHFRPPMPQEWQLRSSVLHASSQPGLPYGPRPLLPHNFFGGSMTGRET